MHVCKTRRISDDGVGDKVILYTRFPAPLDHLVRHFTSFADFAGLQRFETGDEATVANHVLLY